MNLVDVLVCFGDLWKFASILNFTVAARKGRGKQLRAILARIVAINNLPGGKEENNIQAFDSIIIFCSELTFCFAVLLFIYIYQIYNILTIFVIF